VPGWHAPALLGTCPAGPDWTRLANSQITGVPKSGDPKLLFGLKWQKNQFVQLDFFLDKKCLTAHGPEPQ